MKTEWFALIIAVLAVIVGPFVSYKIAKMQIRAQTLKTWKREELNSIRESINEFLSLYSKLVMLVHDKKLGIIDRVKYLETFDNIFQKLLFLRDRFPLILDMKKQINLEFYKHIKSVISIVLETENKDWSDKTVKLSNDIAELGVMIINEEKKILEKKL